MLDIPYVSQVDSKACALACYTMIGRYFFPQVKAEEIYQIARWEPGYVVWEFTFWLWIMSKGISIEHYDPIDYRAWAIEGVEGLRKSVSEKEFAYYKEHTKDLESYTELIQKVLQHPNFSYKRRKPTQLQLEDGIKKEWVCAVVLDSATLNRQHGFDLHQVIVLDVTEDVIVFHDPAKSGGAYRKVSTTLFEHAWLEAVSEPSLCMYRR